MIQTDILMELTMMEDSDNYDQTESDAFKVQQEFEQLAITLMGLQSLRETYSRSIQSLTILRGLKEQHNITRVLCQMESYLDSEGLMRVGRRLQKAGMTYEITHPIILSENFHITTLQVLHTHLLSLHAGPATLLTILNPSYHIEGL